MACLRVSWAGEGVVMSPETIIVGDTHSKLFLFFENTAVETSVVALRIRTFRLHVKFKALSATPFR